MAHSETQHTGTLKEKSTTQSFQQVFYRNMTDSFCISEQCNPLQLLHKAKHQTPQLILNYRGHIDYVYIRHERMDSGLACSQLATNIYINVYHTHTLQTAKVERDTTYSMETLVCFFLVITWGCCVKSLEDESNSDNVCKCVFVWRRRLQDSSLSGSKHHTSQQLRTRLLPVDLSR